MSAPPPRGAAGVDALTRARGPCLSPHQWVTWRGRELPWFENRVSYSASKTKEYDDVAMAHLIYVLYPMVIGSAMYSLLYDKHKSWYSWVISSLVSFIYTFGARLLPFAGMPALAPTRTTRVRALFRLHPHDAAALHQLQGKSRTAAAPALMSRRRPAVPLTPLPRPRPRS